MLSPAFQKIIYDQQKCELETAIERKTARAATNPVPQGQPAWFARLGNKLPHPVSQRASVEPVDPRADPCC